MVLNPTMIMILQSGKCWIEDRIWEEDVSFTCDSNGVEAHLNDGV